MPRPTINKTLQLVLGTMFCLFFSNIEAQAQYDVGPGECVQRSGTCGTSSSTDDSSYTRTYVDPYILEERRRVREANAQEKRRVRAVRKKNRTTYKGISTRQRLMRKSIGADLFRIGGRDNAHVTSVTYEKISGFGGEIFVPGGDFGNIALLRPINPTLHETKIASEQLEKAGAILEFIQSSQRSHEDIAFLADQAAQIMTGGRSYVQVTVGRLSYKNEQYAAQQVTDMTLLTKSLKTTQISLRKSEKERAIILTKAKKDIYELAGLQMKISEAKSKQKKDRLQKRSRELANNLDDFENAYFTKVKEEKKIEQKGVNTAAQLKHKLEWKLGAPILIDVDGNVISK